MPSFLSGLRSALTRATSYGSNTSTPETQQETETVTPRRPRRSASPVKKDPFVEEDSFIHLEASQISEPEQTQPNDESLPSSSRTLSFDEAATPTQPALSTPRHAVDVSTPQTIFQTAQKDVFKSAFKSAAKERDVFMTAKPVRTWGFLAAQQEQQQQQPSSSPVVVDGDDDSSITLSLTLEGTPSVASKRDREEEQDTPVSSKRTRVSKPAESQVTDSQIAELDTSALSDDEDQSALSSSSEWSFEAPPPGLDRKGRRNWKRNQRRAKSAILEQVYGTKKPRSGKNVARSGFKKSVSGREILIGNARRRFWEQRLPKDLYCY